MDAEIVFNAKPELKEFRKDNATKAPRAKKPEEMNKKLPDNHCYTDHSGKTFGLFQRFAWGQP